MNGVLIAVKLKVKAKNSQAKTISR